MSNTNSTTTQQATKGYQGKMCQCKACSQLSDEEREAKALRIAEARRRGGKTRSAQPSMKEARSAGFWSTMERHPFFARNHLKVKIKHQNAQRQRKASMHKLITGPVPRKRKPMKNVGGEV
jgi:hypothetical protein